MKKYLKLLYIICFFALCAIPVLTMPFIEVDNSESGENRQLASLPKVSNEGEVNLQFFNEFDSYLNDNFNYRSTLITLDAYLKEQVFNTSFESEVIIGDDGWLFFAETLDDYLGNDTLSNEEIEDINKTLTLIDEYAKNNGTKFIFTVAPNKSSIYNEYMPWHYLKSENPTNADLINQRVSEDIYLNLFSTLEPTNRDTYLKEDSHWNNHGALLAFNEVIEKYGIEETNFNILSEETKSEHEGDLTTMLYPKSTDMDEQIYHEFDRDYEYVGRFKSLDDITIRTQSETGKDDILIMRDSFGNFWLDYFARQFNTVHYSRAVPYRVDYIKEEKQEYLLIEIVERNIPNLLQTAPIMEAPTRENINAQDLSLIETIDLVSEENADYTHVYGSYESTTDFESVYIVAEYMGEETVFEAFPILEEELNKELNSEAGFSAYLPLDITIKEIKGF